MPLVHHCLQVRAKPVLRLGAAIMGHCQPAHLWPRAPGAAGRYEAGADILDAEWTTLRLELDGPRVQVFVNDQPVMDLKEAKATPEAGDIGLWVDIGTVAWFQNLRVQPR